MLAKKTFVLVLLLVLGSSISSGRYVEDSSERHIDYEEADENESERDMDDEDEGDDFDKPYDEREDSDARHGDTADRDKEDGDDATWEEDEADAREEVVKIHPDQSEEREQEDEDTGEDDGERFEDEDGDDLNDERMMDGDEGGLSLAGHDEEENVADQGGFENFKKKADEIYRENENIQTEIRDMNAKFDQALSSDIAEEAPGLLADDAKAEIQDDTSHQSLSKASSDMSSHTGVQPTAFSEDDSFRQYAEIGEDDNIAPDDDY